MNNGLVAIVLASHPKYSRLPRVISVLDEHKNKCKERIYDLHKINTGEIDKGFLIKRALVDGAYGVTIKEYQEKGLTFAR